MILTPLYFNVISLDEMFYYYCKVFYETQDENGCSVQENGSKVPFETVNIYSKIRIE